MPLRRLSLRHFRNLGVQELAFPPEGAAIVGPNAQGKSNLLEAIYYLDAFRSFRGSRDEQLVAFDEEVFRVVGEVASDAGGEETEVAAAFQRRGRTKKVTVDGVEPDRIGDALGRLGAVVFSPDDVALVTGGPSERRRFLDILLSLNEAGYVRALQQFRHVLSQRNAALREERSPALVRAFDEPLVRAGARVTRSRQAWVARWRETFADHYRHVSGGEEASMTYRADLELPAPTSEGGEEGVAAEAEVAAAYREALREHEERERRAGHTVTGPHRDELVLSLGEGGDGLDLRDYGSGGQRRTAVLALRLVEADTIRETSGHAPVILLDDVFAELDPARSERILSLIEREAEAQVVLTAPKEADVRVRADVLPRWRIRDGRVET